MDHERAAREMGSEVRAGVERDAPARPDWEECARRKKVKITGRRGTRAVAF